MQLKWGYFQYNTENIYNESVGVMSSTILI